jgi:hypothetical protein
MMSHYDAFARLKLWCGFEDRAVRSPLSSHLLPSAARRPVSGDRRRSRPVLLQPESFSLSGLSDEMSPFPREHFWRRSVMRLTSVTVRLFVAIEERCLFQSSEH